jgi:ATP-dependent protease HslVU (ClpYQ) peptidase subunit
MSNGSSSTLTIPPSVFSAGEQINIVQIGVGQVTFAQGAGVTIVSTGATPSAPKISKQYAAATVICTSSNNFIVIGGLV